MTIGIDLGDRKRHVCVLDDDGRAIEESRVTMSPKAIRARFEGQAPARIAIEVGGQSAWVSELLDAMGHEVIVANARKLGMIFQSDSKNDRLDAQQLARVARMDPRLLYPIEHRERGKRVLEIWRSGVGEAELRSMGRRVQGGSGGRVGGRRRIFGWFRREKGNVKSTAVAYSNLARSLRLLEPALGTPLAPAHIRW